MPLVFAEDARPLQAAVLAPDSAGARLRLGSARVDARAGDSLALRVQADLGVLRAAGQLTAQLVADGQEVGRASLQQLADQGLVYRFGAAGTRTVEVYLQRDLPASASAQVAGAAFRLYGITSAVVGTARSSWVRARPFSGLHRNVEMGSGCVVDGEAAAGTCGGAAYTITPFASNGARGFQSGPGYAPSGPISVEFATPVQTVGVTIGDPTYDGNTAVAYDSAGNVVASAGFASSGVPGEDVPDTQYLSAPAISRVVLTPAENDYVYYLMSVNVPDSPGTASLDCGQGPVTRGTTITCTASGIGTITSWTFRSDDGEHTVGRQPEDNIGSTVWKGPLVLGGTITVTGTSAGIRKQSASVRVGVTPRDWGGKTQPDDIRPIGSGSLPPEPTGFNGQFGLTSAIAASTAQQRTTTSLVSSGPNQGLTYYLDVPVHVTSDVAVNYTALNPGSAFGQLQFPTDTVVNGKPRCGRDRFPGLLKAIEEHEGLHGEPNSHTRLFHDAAFGLAALLFESVVGTIYDDGGFGVTLQQVNQYGADVSGLRDGPLNNLTTAPTVTSTYVIRCDFIYFASNR